MYRYFNLRTKASAQTTDYNEKVIEDLMKDEAEDIILVTSSYSQTLKIYKWHCADYAGDWEGPEKVGECDITVVRDKLKI